MELAKVTSKGQVTIPIEIRKKLGIKNGDKILFVEESGRIYMMNSSMDALRKVQREFAGEAERLGIKNDEDVMEMIKELRKESVVE
jgi:AbrB family looped-hinge helix DNA binding protein